MSLTNAERQERYRQRLKAAARGSDVGERARHAMDDGIAALWEVHARAGAIGKLTLPDYRGHWALRPSKELEAALVAAKDLAGTAELARIDRTVEVIRAVRLAHV